MENATVLTLQYDEAIQKLDLAFLASYCEKIYDGAWLVFKEDAHFDKLDLDTLAQKDRYSQYAILFEKDLVIDGALLQSETDFGPLVVVKGKTKAKNVFVGGGCLYCQQGLSVEQTVIGVYNHGTIHIKGDIEAELIISDGHAFNFRSEQIKKGIRLGFDDFERGVTDITSDLYEMEDVLKSKYWDRCDEVIKQNQILKALIAGVSLKKEGKIETPLQKRITQFKNSKKGILDLSWMKLEEIPPDVFTLEGIVELNLSENYIERLPSRLLELKQLKKIRLYNCAFTHFPTLLSEIATLEEIDLGKNLLQCLPQDMIKLKQLKNLELYNCAFEVFPQVLYTLPNLESLNISYQGGNLPTFIIDKPFEKLKNLNISANLGVQITAPQPELKILNMRNCALTQIPRAIAQSLKLTSLNITINDKIISLPEELSQLRKLTDLAIPLANVDESSLDILHCLPKLATLRLEFRDQLPPQSFHKIIELKSWTSLYIEGYLEDQFLIKDILKCPTRKKIVIGDHNVNISRYR